MQYQIIIVFRKKKRDFVAVGGKSLGKSSNEVCFDAAKKLLVSPTSYQSGMLHPYGLKTRIEAEARFSCLKGFDVLEGSLLGCPFGFIHDKVASRILQYASWANGRRICG